MASEGMYGTDLHLSLLVLDGFQKRIACGNFTRSSRIRVSQRSPCLPKEKEALLVLPQKAAQADAESAVIRKSAKAVVEALQARRSLTTHPLRVRTLQTHS